MAYYLRRLVLGIQENNKNNTYDDKFARLTMRHSSGILKPTYVLAVRTKTSISSTIIEISHLS